MFNKKIAIDLGTANTLIALPKKKIIINEPTVLAVSVKDNKILAVGLEAKAMIGRTPDEITAVRPLRDGAIADYRMTEAIIKYFIHKTLGGIKFFRPEIIVSIPAGITSTERRAVVDATLQAGAKTVYLVKEPIAAAIGAGVPIHESCGNMIIDIGGGTTEIAVISLGGIVAINSVRTAGNKFDQAIQDLAKNKYNLAIGDQTSEEIKIKIGSVIKEKKQKEIQVRGRDLWSGLPKNIVIDNHSITASLQEVTRQIVRSIKQVLQRTPPELSADIIDRGIIMSGGGSLIKGINQVVSKETGLNCFKADDPLFCVVNGLSKILENYEKYKQNLSSFK